MTPDREAGRVVAAGASTAAVRAPIVMAQTVWRARAVVAALVGRDLRSRYVGSSLGAVWSLAHPLLQLATLSFVFATVLKVRVTASGGGDVPFVLYLACGLFPWLAIQEGVLRGATSMVDNPTLVKRVVFPVETLPVELALAAVVHQLVATVVLLGLMAVLGFPPRPTLLALPVLLVPQLLITIGLAWGAAAMHVYFRDTAQALGVLLPVWFYLTPIIYPYALVPPLLQPVLAVNPLTPLVEGYREILLHGVLPSGLDVVWLGIASLVVFAAGAVVFTRARGEFADLV